jgi:protein O-GlcNAc transferase
MKQRNRSLFRTAALAVAFLSVPLTASAGAAPAPWQRQDAASVRCDSAARDRFWETADWGAVPSLQGRLVEYCESSGSVRCTPDLRFCQAKGIRLDIPAAGSPPIEASTACALSGNFPRSGPFLGNLSDWGPELRGLRSSKEAKPCDVVIHEPTLLIKRDSGGNIYHGLCDHVNLFLSMWAAGWQDAENLRIVTWEPTVSGERVSSAWYGLYDAFTNLPVRPLGAWAGQNVCFDDAVFAVNPRAIDTFYYNMDVPGRAEGCRSGPDGFVRAYAERTRASLHVPPRRRPGPGEPVRIKVLSRGAGTGKTSGTRQLTNEAELVAAVRRRLAGEVEIEIVNFDWNGRPTIEQQVALMADTDILVGMHGAGLVHTLWLPEWAVVYEVYNCGDTQAYPDLARLAGVEYMTGKDSDVVQRYPPGVPVAEADKANPKFWNYEIAEDAFVTNIQEAVRRVRAYPAPPSGLPGKTQPKGVPS